MHHKNFEIIGPEPPAACTDFQKTDPMASPFRPKANLSGLLLAPSWHSSVARGRPCPRREPVLLGPLRRSKPASPCWSCDTPERIPLLGLEALNTNTRPEQSGRRARVLRSGHPSFSVNRLPAPDEVPAARSHPSGEGRGGPKFTTPQYRAA